jgi:hypothetical protein
MTIITVSQLKAKMERSTPGIPFEKCPDHPPMAPRSPIKDCELCSGTGWRLSERYGTWFICKCTLDGQSHLKDKEQYWDVA